MALASDVERVLLHVNRIEEILESQRRLGPDKDLAVASELLPLVNSAIRSLPDGHAECPALRLDRSLALQPHVPPIRSVVLQQLGSASRSHSASPPLALPAAPAPTPHPPP